MLVELDTYIANTAFVVWDAGPAMRRLVLSKQWNSYLCSDRTKVSASLDRLVDEQRNVILVVFEQDFLAAVELMQKYERRLVDKKQIATFGIVVVSARAEEFLTEKGNFRCLLDVVPEKNVHKTLQHHLLKVVRLLMLSDERENPRLGRKTLEKLNEIFIALSAERDPKRLLATILVKAIELAHASGGVLYLSEEQDGEMCFRLKIESGHSNEVSFEHTDQRVIENSIAGYAALTGKVVNIADVSMVDSTNLPRFMLSVDHGADAQAHSLLCIPLKNSRDEVIAVLELSGGKLDPRSNDHALEIQRVFSAEDESLLVSFATQAAICIENVDLYADIQRLFEGFIKASVTAIEARDPSTGGHSERVAKLSVGLARATSDCEVGIYRSVRFKEEEIRELEYAALLHDFGKIGVREEILCKAKKLYPHQLETIRERIKICRAAAKIAFLEKKLKQPALEKSAEVEYRKRLADIERYWGIIQAVNEPNVLEVENKQSLAHMRTEQMLLPDGTNIPVLTEDEFQALSVSKGSLTDSERLEIESHVRHTYQFLKMIPWTKDFKHLTEIAYCHHEKLDGSGYPRKLVAHEIPLQSKIMTIVDIFDALTAADRWYKEAVPVERAIEILGHEVALGQLDPVLFELFVQKKIYELTHPKRSSAVA